MKRLIALIPLIVMAACQRPEVEAFRKAPTPIVVRFAIPSEVPNGEDVKKEYAAALRARLATRTTVVPEGVKAPENAADLKVTITALRAPGTEPSPAKVGVITGVAVGTLSAIAGNRDAPFDGFFWGLWAGTHAAQARRYDLDRLGFRPMHVQAQVALCRAGDPEPLHAFAVEPFEVIDAMDPLKSSEKDDEFRVREEEAKALARVIVFKIQERFNWLPLPKASWYGAKEGVNREEESSPKAEEAPKPAEPAPAAPAPAVPETPKAPEPAPAPVPPAPSDPAPKG